MRSSTRRSPSVCLASSSCSHPLGGNLSSSKPARCGRTKHRHPHMPQNGMSQNGQLKSANQQTRAYLFVLNRSSKHLQRVVRYYKIGNTPRLGRSNHRDERCVNTWDAGQLPVPCFQILSHSADQIRQKCACTKITPATNWNRGTCFRRNASV